MRLFLIALGIGVVYGGSLELPVAYDPFVKAQKIIKPIRRKVQRVAQPKLKLKAIFNDKAYINGRFYRVGQRVGGARIVAIQEDRVVLEQGGRQMVLPLWRKRVLRVGR